MICQRATKAVIHIFTHSGFSADVYLDDFYDAEIPALADTAFAALQTLFLFFRISLFTGKRFTARYWNGLFR